MKKTVILLIVLCYQFMDAQVGIGQNVTTFDNSEVLKISSPNKGVLLPNVNISDINSPLPITSPANSLVVYNTNTTTGKGFYYWLVDKWKPYLNTTNIYKYLKIIRSETIVSTGAVIDDSEITGVSYTIGEAPSAHQWELIPGLTQQISVYSPQNELSITAGGIVQVNSASSENTFISYSVGLFIDSKLTGVRNFIISGNDDCLYNDYNVFFTVSNLTAGGNHLIELRETMRVKEISTQSISFGAKHSSCSNLSPLMDKSIMNIEITEL